MKILKYGLVFSVILSMNIYADKYKEYVVVNGESINAKTVQEMSGYNQRQFESMSKDQQKILLDKIIDHVLLRQEAVRVVSNTQEYKTLLKNEKEKLVIKLWMDKLKNDANIIIYDINKENSNLTPIN